MESGRNSRFCRNALFAGVLVFLMLPAHSRPAAAAENGRTSTGSARQVQILDPFSLRILAVEARVPGAVVSAIQPANKNDKGGPCVDVPVRRRPRSPFLPPGPPPWPPGPPPWVK